MKRRDAERAEEVCRDARALNPFGACQPCQVVRGARCGHVERERVEDAAALLHVNEVRVGDADLLHAELRERVPHSHDAFRLRVRQRAEHDRVEGAEDDRVRADAEREREQRYRRERRTLPQKPRRVPQVSY